MIRSWQDEKSQLIVPRVGFPRKPLPPFTRGVPFLRRFEKRNNPPNRPLDRYWLRPRRVTSQHHAGARGRRGKMISSLACIFSFFLHPRLIFPPHARMSYCHSYVSVLRNAYNPRITDCLDEISTFLGFPTRYRFLRII